MSFKKKGFFLLATPSSGKVWEASTALFFRMKSFLIQNAFINAPAACSKRRGLLLLPLARRTLGLQLSYGGAAPSEVSAEVPLFFNEQTNPFCCFYVEWCCFGESVAHGVNGEHLRAAAAAG